MNKILLLLILVCASTVRADNTPVKLEAFAKNHPQYIKLGELLILTEKKAWEQLVIEANHNDQIRLTFISHKPWIIGDKYFFPREEVMKSFNKKYREFGVYVDGTNGKVEPVDTARKIHLNTQ